MSAYRRDLPLIPVGGWRTKAACTERVGEMLWDDRLEGETDKARDARHVEAKRVCNTECPVRQQCSDDTDWRIDEGIRGGHELPTLWGHRTPADKELSRRLRKGMSLDAAAGRSRAS